VNWLSDNVLAHLCKLDNEPDLSGTRYEMIEKIGQGGMGSVYLVRDRALDRQLALKVLNDVPSGAIVEARLEREARIIARLEHPGIVPVHDAGVLQDGRLYYAMKLVRGKRLDEWVYRATSVPERLQLFEKICDAVAFAHAHGIIHRDLKPQNIMIGPFGEVLVMDWGVAKELGQNQSVSNQSDKNGPLEASQTIQGTVVGTPGYMAPEQARGDSAVDAGSDIYSLGAILYFLLTGQAPAQAEHDPDASMPASTLIPPRRLDRSIPRPLEAICLKALSAEREGRYTEVTEFVADIASFRAGRRVRAHSESLIDAARRFGSKYRAVIALVLAYLLMRILLLIFAGF